MVMTGGLLMIVLPTLNHNFPWVDPVQSPHKPRHRASTTSPSAPSSRPKPRAATQRGKAARKSNRTKNGGLVRWKNHPIKMYHINYGG